jgi:hypothetical protein
VWHPWRAIRERPEITVRWEPIPGRLGQWCQRTMTMTLHPEQSQRQRRCTAAHELIHAERGHYGACRSTVDRAVSIEAARRLIPLDHLADALVWSQDEWEVAEELWVDVPTTRLRIETLTPQEKDYIERRIAAREGAA